MLSARSGESTRIIESAQSTRNERLDAQAVRGALFRKTGRFDLAIVDLTEVLRNRPSADDVPSSAGWRWWRTGSRIWRWRTFDEAIGLNPDNTDGAQPARGHCIARRDALPRRYAIWIGQSRLNRDDPWAVSERASIASRCTSTSMRSRTSIALWS